MSFVVWGSVLCLVCVCVGGCSGPVGFVVRIDLVLLVCLGGCLPSVACAISGFVLLLFYLCFAVFAYYLLSCVFGLRFVYFFVWFWFIACVGTVCDCFGLV